MTLPAGFSRQTSIFALLALVAIFHSRSPAPADEPKTRQPVAVAADGLPNAYRLHDRVISGGLPDGETAFQSLQALGVRTIISVDGAKPDVERAARFGLRYVHLPHGYDGVPETRAKELAKAIRDLPGPVYIHCHHGKHRSPAAAAVACVATGLLDTDEAMQVLETAGTSKNYRGLYGSVAAAMRLNDALLDEFKVEFQETIEVPPLAGAMVEIENIFDRIKIVAANQWQPTPRHPDLDSAHQALLLREHYQELLRTDEVQQYADDFHQRMHESWLAAQRLEGELQRWKPAGYRAPTPAGVIESFRLVAEDCKTCHQRFRDVPLAEKAAR